MSTDIEPAVSALTDGISEILGPPRVQTNEKVLIWSRFDFEVALQCDVGPHAWVPGEIQPEVDPLRGLEVDEYPADRTRHSGLRTTSMLSEGHEARRIVNAGDHISDVIRAIREYVEGTNRPEEQPRP